MRPVRVVSRAVVTALVVLGAALAVAVPAAAQVVPPVAEQRRAIDRCIATGIAEGAAPLNATRSCVDDPAELDGCIERADADLPVQRAVDRCLDELLADGRIAYPDGEEREATTTTVEEDADDPVVTTTMAVDEGGAAAGDVGDDLDVATPSSGSDGTSTPVVAGIALAAFAAGALLAGVLGRRRAAAPPAASPMASFPPAGPVATPVSTGPAPAPVAPVAPPVTPPGGPFPVDPSPVAGPAAVATAVRHDDLGGDEVEERRALVRALVELGDLVTSDALRTHVAERLEAAGVLPVLVAPGTRFDPSAHRGVQAQPAPSEAQDGTVASCDRAGWSDRGELLRPPEVVVYRWEVSS